MSRFSEHAPFEDIPPFNPNDKSDEVIVQVVERTVEKIVKEKAPEPVIKTVYIPTAPPQQPPGLTREALTEIVAEIGKLAVTRPNVEVSVAPTPVNVTPQAVQVAPAQITVNESPTPRRWKVTVTERDTSPEKRIKELTIEAVD